MSVVWYDIAFEQDPDQPGWFDIERIYCLDWDLFDDVAWAQLSSIYKTLPEHIDDQENGCPRWFAATDDPQHGYLTASVEPPGLQVFGSLSQIDWENWDAQFQAGISNLPFRTLQ